MAQSVNHKKREKTVDKRRKKFDEKRTKMEIKAKNTKCNHQQKKLKIDESCIICYTNSAFEVHTLKSKKQGTARLDLVRKCWCSSVGRAADS